MDGYAIFMGRDLTCDRIEKHALTQSTLIRLLEDCVPEGSRIVGLVIRNGSQIQTKPLLELVP